MTTETLKYIAEISNELKNLHGDDYGEQFCNRVLHVINNNPAGKTDFQIIFEGVYSLIDNDYKDKLIFNLQKKIKEQDARIRTLEKEINTLKEDNKQLNEDNKQKDIKINKLEKQVNVLMRNHNNLVLWQAYKNLEYYIIQKATGYDSTKMDLLNTNLTMFLADEKNKDYKDQIMILMEKFQINSYEKSLGKLIKNRLREAHPNPIEMDELAQACQDMKLVYPGIEKLYEGYQEVYDGLVF